MTQLLLTAAALLFFLNIPAQQEKPFLLISRYNMEKSFMCSPRAWISEEVNDRQEYALKRNEFVQEHKTSNPSTEFISAKECVTVYEYKKKQSGFDCQPTVHGIVKGMTIESYKEQLKNRIEKMLVNMPPNSK
jgi:hypothetical protein